MDGAGIRSMVELAPMSLVGALNAALPRMLNHRTLAGTNVLGFLNSLAPDFGPGSFDAGNEDTRYEAFLQSPQKTAAALGTAWRNMQHVVGDSTDAPLSRPVGVASSGTLRLTSHAS